MINDYDLFWFLLVNLPAGVQWGIRAQNQDSDIDQHIGLAPANSL